MLLLRSACVIATVVFALVGLSVLFMREKVKQELRAQGLRPVRVRWVPCAWWKWGPRSAAFRVVATDANGNAVQGRCSVYSLNRRITWIPENQPYLPRPMPFPLQVLFAVAGVLLVGWGMRGLFTQSLPVPRAARHSGGETVRGWTAAYASLAMICTAGWCWTAVAWQYARVGREKLFAFAARRFSLAAWLFVWLAVLTAAVLAFQAVPQS